MSNPNPRFYLNVNAENCNIYHNDHPFLHNARLVSDEKDQTVWALDSHGAEITENRTTYAEAGITACRQTTTLCNKGDKPLTVDILTSAFITDIGKEGGVWYDRRFKIYYAHSAWQGEGQWRSAYAEDLGLYPTYNHGHQSTFRIASTGNWTTGQRHPLLVIEDTKLEEAWYFEIHSPIGWYIEVSAQGYQENSSLCVFLSAAYEKNDGWFVTLAPGESYTTVPAVWGHVKGGFEEAIGELTVYKRQTAHTTFPSGVVPVCFNDYMNCLWASPTRKRLVPLIEAAAHVGAEVFCIDAGWFGDQSRSCHWSETLGDWEPNDELFGEGGLAGIIKEISDHGMLPGVWLEIETVHLSSKFAKAHPEAILRRHGHPIGNPTSSMDYRQPVVREHIMGVFDRLYDMGIRFVKNDYNHTVGLAADSLGGDECSVEHMMEHSKAFFDFVDEVIATHPGLMIENCGSGAMRCDHATLSHFHVQSTSDQEYYDRYPSIVQGMVACMPPERAGIWAYPYPMDFHSMPTYPDTDVAPTGEDYEKLSDPRQTAFNMVNGMMGCLYLSGRISYADEQGTALIHKAIELYKANRKTLMGAVPVYPLGLSRIEGGGWTAMGLLNREEGKLLLALWRVRDDEPDLTLDLTKYLSEDAEISNAYPDLEGFGCSLNDGYLTVTFPEGNCAGYFEINL